MLDDLRHAFRLLIKYPRFTATVCVTLALGIGATTSMYSLLDVLVFPQIPVADPDTLVRISSRNEQRQVFAGPISAPEYVQWRDRARSFSDMAAMVGGSSDLSGDGSAERVTSRHVTPSWFRILGVEPFFGRSFSDGEERVAIISHALWQRRYGGDPTMPGRSIRLDGVPHVVTGIMPRQFWFESRNTDVWIPLQIEASGDWNVRFLAALGRLRHGVTRDAAAAEMGRIGEDIGRDQPASNAGWSARVGPLYQPGSGEATALAAMFAAAATLLLIGCVNVANLLLNRATSRTAEMAIRGALGASRPTLMRQLLLESLLLSVVGCALGLLFATWTLDLMRNVLTTSSQPSPLAGDLGINWRVTAVAAGMSILAALLFGLAPALRSSRTDLVAALKSGSQPVFGGPAARRARNTLLVAEVSLALALLIVGGLLVRTVVAYRNIPLGFEKEGILTFRITPSNVDLHERILERLATVPGVINAAATSRTPLAGGGAASITFQIDRRTDPSADSGPWAAAAAITPAYFETLRLPIVRGRDFSSRDTADRELIAIVSREAVRRFWGQSDPVGSRVRVGESWLLVAGVAADARNDDAGAPPIPQIYFPLAHRPQRGLVYIIRTSPAPLSLESAIRREVQALDPDLPIYQVRPMNQVFNDDLLGPMVIAGVVAWFAALAALLAVIGVYSVLSYSVGQRSGEIAIRMALGADRGHVARMIASQNGLIAALGVLVGLALAFGVSRVLSSTLYGVGPTDVLTYCAASGAIFGLAVLASYVPARRATRIEPVQALKCQ